MGGISVELVYCVCGGVGVVLCVWRGGAWVVVTMISGNSGGGEWVMYGRYVERASVVCGGRV